MLELTQLMYLDREERRGCRFIHFECSDKEVFEPYQNEHNMEDFRNYSRAVKGFLRESHAGYDVYLDDRTGVPIFIDGITYTKEEVRLWAMESIRRKITNEEER